MPSNRFVQNRSICWSESGPVLSQPSLVGNNNKYRRIDVNVDESPEVTLTLKFPIENIILYSEITDAINYKAQ